MNEEPRRDRRVVPTGPFQGTPASARAQDAAFAPNDTTSPSPSLEATSTSTRTVSRKPSPWNRGLRARSMFRAANTSWSDARTFSLPLAVVGGSPAADDGCRKSTWRGAPPPLKYKASSPEAQRQLTLAWTTVPPLDATQDASASVLAFWRRMASRCLGIITFVASARRVWRSIIALRVTLCASAASSSGDVIAGTAPSASGVARALLRGPSDFVGYLCLPVARRRMHWRASRVGLHALS